MTHTAVETARQALTPAPIGVRRVVLKLSGEVFGGGAVGVDPTVVRVLAAVTMVVTFPVGVIAYAVMWAVIPKE